MHMKETLIFLLQPQLLLQNRVDIPLPIRPTTPLFLPPQNVHAVHWQVLAVPNLQLSMKLIMVSTQQAFSTEPCPRVSLSIYNSSQPKEHNLMSAIDSYVSSPQTSRRVTMLHGGARSTSFPYWLSASTCNTILNWSYSMWSYTRLILKQENVS